jgi:hypothetical protein
VSSRLPARVRRAPAWTITAGLGVVYLIAAPVSPDLAAADYRSHLFSQVGFSLWDNSWYGGHHLLAYSVLAPALGSMIGTQPLTAISMTLAAWLFAVAIEGRFPARATRIAAAWFALGAGIALLSSRVPFDLGLALGLGALVLAQRGRFAPAVVLTILASLASPVAGAFLALAMLAWALAGAERVRPAVLCVAALLPIAALSFAFPEGGSQPFVASAFYPAVAAVLVVGLAMPREQRTLRTGAALYVLAMIGSYLIPTAVGGNADRLGSLIAGPMAACALAGGADLRRLRALIVLGPLLLYWQSVAPVVDFASTVSNPTVEASYYRPLLAEFKRLDIGYGRHPARVEVVATADHWEARWVAPATMIARGWERQLDRYRNGLFYKEGGPTAAEYSNWLSAQAISYVALPDAHLDYSARAEARLLNGPADGTGSFLREVWHSRHWRLFAVLRPTPLVQPPARLAALGTSSFAIDAPAAGNYEVRLHFTPYWAVEGGRGCVERGPEDWTIVRAARGGETRVAIDFSLGRMFAHGARCG